MELQNEFFLYQNYRKQLSFHLNDILQHQLGHAHYNLIETTNYANQIVFLLLKAFQSFGLHLKSHQQFHQYFSVSLQIQHFPHLIFLQ